MLPLAAALVAGAVVLYLVLPLVLGEEASLDRAAEEPDEERARRRVVLRGIRDAEYDFEMGKLDEKDYRELRTELAHEALDLIEPRDGSAEGGAASGTAPPGPRPGAPAARSAPSGAPPALFCPSCGVRARAGSRFCSECGTRLPVVGGPEGSARQGGGLGTPSGEPA